MDHYSCDINTVYGVYIYSAVKTKGTSAQRRRFIFHPIILRASGEQPPLCGNLPAAETELLSSELCLVAANSRATPTSLVLPEPQFVSFLFSTVRLLKYADEGGRASQGNNSKPVLLYPEERRLLVSLLFCLT